MKLNFNKNGGYVTAIAQDYNTGQVLMVGHANKAAVETALQTGLATWWSMSRNELWTKGLTSGDTLKLKQVRTDCDRDAILYLVEPQGTGGACHVEGWFSCFGSGVGLSHETLFVQKPTQPERLWSAVLLEEETMIQGRKEADSSDSHTAKSLGEPISRIAQKIGEEGLEVALALTDPDQDNQTVINEAADLLYRLQIGLAKSNISWSKIEAEIRRRRK